MNKKNLLLHKEHVWSPWPRACPGGSLAAHTRGIAHSPVALAESRSRLCSPEDWDWSTCSSDPQLRAANHLLPWPQQQRQQKLIHWSLVYIPSLLTSLTLFLKIKNSKNNSFLFLFIHSFLNKNSATQKSFYFSKDYSSKKKYWETKGKKLSSKTSNNFLQECLSSRSNNFFKNVWKNFLQEHLITSSKKV